VFLKKYFNEIGHLNFRLTLCCIDRNIVIISHQVELKSKSGRNYTFMCDRWLADDEDDKKMERDLVAEEDDKKSKYTQI
jgi:hypothetical protein